MNPFDRQTKDAETYDGARAAWQRIRKSVARHLTLGEEPHPLFLAGYRHGRRDRDGIEDIGAALKRTGTGMRGKDE